MSSRSLGDRATSFGAAPCRIQRWYSSRLWSSWSLAAFVGIAGSTILTKILASTFQAPTKLAPSAFIRGSLESEAQSTTMWAVAALDRRERPAGGETLPVAVCRYCPSAQSVLRASVRSRFPTNCAREGRWIETLLLSTAAPSASTNRIATDTAIRRNHLKKVSRAERLPGGILILVLGTCSNRETGRSKQSRVNPQRAICDKWDSNRLHVEKGVRYPGLGS